MLKAMDDLPVEGRRVLLRVDFNVPEQNGKVMDDFRIRRTIPTIKLLKKRGAKAIILLSHRSRTKGENTNKSLRFVSDTLSEALGDSVTFVPESIGTRAQEAVDSAKGGEVLLLENLREHEGEERNEDAFALALARLGDMYVVEAFGVLHRMHASLVRLPQLLPTAAGPLVAQEVETISRLRENPEQPFVAIIGGAKISTKLPIIKSLLPNVSSLCLGGALANTVLKAKGIAIGRSVVEDKMVDEMKSFEVTDTKLHIPIDVVVSEEPSGNAAARETGAGGVLDEELILDIGPETEKLFSLIISQAKTVFWNGPMGLSEVEPFRHGTEAITRAIAKTDAFTVVGGGDTTQFPIKMGLEDKISFISTGGGAMLKLLAGETLPGIAAISEPA